MTTLRFSLLVVLLLSLNLLAQNTTGSGTDEFGEDWPVFLGPTGDSKSTEVGIRKDWQRDFPVVWQIPLSESYGTCSVSQGYAFQFDRQHDQGILLCLHRETGQEVWRYTYEYEYRDAFNYNGGPRTSPLVDGERVFLFGVAGTMICVDTRDGKEIWKVDANKKYGVVQNFFGVGSNPVVHDNLIIAMVGGSPQESQHVTADRLDRVIGNGTGIVAFDKATGEEVYRLTDDLASYASLKQIQHRGRPWCFAFQRSGLTVFDPSSGKLDFRFPWRARTLESVNASVPVVFGDRVFISETYGPGSALLKFDQGKPEVIWKDDDRSRDKSMQTHWNTAVYHDGYLYGSSGRHTNNAELRCINASNGKVMWSKGGLTRSSLLYIDDHFVCLSEDGELRLLKASPEAYEEVTSIRLMQNGESLLKYPAWAAPIVSHGLLYVRGADRLVCLELIPRA